jgi:hypothetical protein
VAKLESLIVSLELETAELRKGLDEVKQKLGDVGKATEGLFHFEIFKEIGHLALEAAEKLGEFALKGAETADQMGKLAQQVGIPVETLSRLNYAASLSKLSTEEFGLALGKLNIKIAGAASGNKEAAALFKVLGVAVKDAAGATRSADQVIGDLAGVFSGLKDGASKGALAVDLFGKSGKQLIPFLNEGKEGIARLSDEADRFGITISGKTVAAATEFNDNIDRMKKVIDGVGVQVAAQLAPAMAAFTDQLLNSKSSAETLKDVVNGLVIALKVLVTVAVTAAGAFSYLGTEIGGNLAAIAATLTGDFDGAREILNLMDEDLKEVTSNVGGRFKAIWDSAGEATKDAAAATKKSADSMVSDLERLKNASEAAMEARFRLAKAMAEKLATEHFMEGESASRAADITRSGAQAQQQFNNIGAPDTKIFDQATGHFKDFDAAMQTYVAAQLDINKWTETANEAKKNFDVEGFDEARAVIDQDKALASKAKTAADAFSGAAQKAVADMDKLASAIGAAASHLLSKLGNLGSVIQSGIQGFQQGGWWGAIAAVLIEILARFDRFKEVVELSDKVLFDLIDALKPGLNALVNGFDSLMQGLDSLFKVIGSLLQGPLKGIGIMLDHVGRTISGIMDGGLGDAISALGDFGGAIMGIVSVLDPMKPILKLLGALFSLVGIGLLYVMAGIQKGLAAALEGLRNLLAKLGLDDAALAISKIENQMQAGSISAEDKAKAMWSKLGNTFEHFFDEPSGGDIKTDIAPTVSGTADAIKDLGKSSEKTAKSFDKLTEQFTNVPQGFKTNLRTWQATAAAGGSYGMGRDEKGDWGGGPRINVTVMGSILSEMQLKDLIKRLQSQDSFRRKGTV